MRLRTFAVVGSRDPRNLRRAIMIGVVVLAGGFGYALRAARASGIPSTGALAYSGILTDAVGAPLTSPQNVGVAIYDAPSAGNKVCERPSQSTTLDPGGRFQVALPDACAAAVGASKDLWIEVSLAGAPLGRAKTGAVPYAVEANNAAQLQGLTLSQLGPPAGMIAMFAATCPAGWTLCNGTGGTPNLIGSYVKGGATFAATVGQNTHSHTLALNTASGGGHHHYAQIDWNGGPLYAHFANFAGDATVVIPAGAGPWTASSHFTVGNPGGPYGTGLDSTVDNGGMLTTDVAAHSHAVSGTTADTNHEPVHATLVFCMKN